METAIQYIELQNDFIAQLLKNYQSVERYEGRKFDRIAVDDVVEYFIDKHTWIIYGAKSALQYNPRRTYGTLSTTSQFDWTTNTPITGSIIETEWERKEAEIVSGYKKRGRPRKVVHTQPTSIPKVSV
jgi:hypothetical protein